MLPDRFLLLYPSLLLTLPALQADTFLLRLLSSPSELPLLFPLKPGLFWTMQILQVPVGLNDRRMFLLTGSVRL